jgi:hypothetical protein
LHPIPSGVRPIVRFSRFGVDAGFALRFVSRSAEGAATRIVVCVGYGLGK